MMAQHTVPNMVRDKPDQYSSVAPYLIVEGASRTIEFLTAVFDATELYRLSSSRPLIE